MIVDTQMFKALICSFKGGISSIGLSHFNKSMSLKAWRNMIPCISMYHMDVSKNRGVYPPKWMVKMMENPENPIKMDDLGVPVIFGNTHISRIFNMLLHFPQYQTGVPDYCLLNDALLKRVPGPFAPVVTTCR